MVWRAFAVLLFAAASSPKAEDSAGTYVLFPATMTLPVDPLGAF